MRDYGPRYMYARDLVPDALSSTLLLSSTITILPLLHYIAQVVLE